MQRPALSTRPSHETTQSDRSDAFIIQLEDLQRSISDAHAHDDSQWVLKMYMRGLDRALSIGLPMEEAQEQALAAAAGEVQEAVARALVARS